LVEITNAPAATPASLEPSNAPPELAVTNTAEGPGDYTILKGETFLSVARTFHISVQSIADANPGVQSTRLKIGQRIHLPATVQASATAMATATNNATGTNSVEVSGADGVYTVKAGDRLFRIAGQFGVTLNALRETNHLKTDRIEVGQKLKIPVKTPAGGA
jgi:LysM repeat protein